MVVLLLESGKKHLNFDATLLTLCSPSELKGFFVVSASVSSKRISEICAVLRQANFDFTQN